MLSWQIIVQFFSCDWEFFIAFSLFFHLNIRLKPDKQLVKEAEKKEVLQNINLITEPGRVASYLISSMYIACIFVAVQTLLKGRSRSFSLRGVPRANLVDKPG